MLYTCVLSNVSCISWGDNLPLIFDLASIPMTGLCDVMYKMASGMNELTD